MRNNDFIFRCIDALVGNELPVNRFHVQAINHHQGGDDDLRTDTAACNHFRQMRFLKKKLAVNFIILLIESAAGDENADGHSAVLGN